MTKFYEVHNEDGRAQALVAHEGGGEHSMYAWLANTEHWHRDFAMENAFYAITPDMTFVELSPDEVVAKAAAWPKLDGRRASWLIDELSAAESKTSSQLGLPRAATARPVTDVQVMADLKRSGGDWTVVKSYDADKLKAARSLASDLRTGKRKSLAPLGVLEVRVRPSGIALIVEAKIAQLGKLGTKAGRTVGQEKGV